MKKILLFAILGMFLISFASATITHQKDTDLDFQLVCENNGYCSTAATCNVSVWNPSNTQIISNQQLTNQVSYHNLTIPGTLLSESGTYQVSGFCQDGTLSSPVDMQIKVNLNGNSVTMSESITYFVLLFGVIIFFLISTFAFIKLPFKNSRRDDGKVISINDLKYLKVLFFFLSYGLLTWIANIMIEVSSSLLNSSVTLGFFSMLFKVMTAALYPVMILTIIGLAVLYINDSKIKKSIARGL